MKILEAERWLKSANLHKVVLLQQQQEEDKIDSPTASMGSPTVRPPEGIALARIPPSEHRRAPSRGPEGGRARRMQEERGMATTREINPFLKGDFPSCAPERHGQSLPRCAPRIPPYDTGARPHTSYRLTQSTKKANHHTRSG
jgi:hypothetical protein